MNASALRQIETGVTREKAEVHRVIAEELDIRPLEPDESRGGCFADELAL